MSRSVASTPHVRAVGRAITFASVFAVAIATLVPAPGTATADHWCVACGDTGGTDFLLNILLFVPLGIGAALAGARWWTAAIAFALASATIEGLQLTVIAGRDAVIGDVIANFAGGMLGYLVAAQFPALTSPRGVLAACLTVGWSAAWLALQLVSSAAFVPAPTASTYYGQIAHDFPHLEPFPGRVLSFTIDDAAVADGRLVGDGGIARAMRAGAAVGATAEVDARTGGVAEIVGVMDAEHRVITMLGQRGTGMTFTVRTLAAPMRLRPPHVLLEGAFTRAIAVAGRAAAAVALSARWGPRAVTMRAADSGEVIARSVALRPELGWTLFFPAQWLISGSLTERMISALWCLLPLIPLAFWATFVIEEYRAPSTRAALASALIALLASGWFVVPSALGTASVSMIAVASSALGLLIGHIAAVRCITLAKKNIDYISRTADAPRAMDPGAKT